VQYERIRKPLLLLQGLRIEILQVSPPLGEMAQGYEEVGQPISAERSGPVALSTASGFFVGVRGWIRLLF